MITAPLQHRHRALAALIACVLALHAGAQSNATVAAAAAKPSHKAQRVLLVGDSLMKGLSLALEGELRKQPGVVTRVCAGTWTGLARLDLFDWHEQAAAHCQQFKPDTVLVWLGADDHESLKTFSGSLKPGTPEWTAEYTRRVGLLMDLFINGGAQRVFWMDLPDVRDDKAQEGLALVRDIQRKEAKRRPEITVIYIRKLLSPVPGKFCPYLVGDASTTVDIRADDGINLNLNGAKLVAANVAPLLFK